MSMQQSEGAAEARGMSAVRTANGLSTRPDHVRLRSKREARRARERAEVEEAARLGVAVVPKLRIDRCWTEAEDEIVRRLKDDDKALIAALPGRTPSAIHSRRANLFVADRMQFWTTAEDKILRAKLDKVAKIADLEQYLPGRKAPGIRYHMDRLGLKLKPKAADTGNPLLDAIKDRCRALGYTMKDLDRIAKTGSYFAKKTYWRSGVHTGERADAKSVLMSASFSKALIALGGTLRVDWPDDGESIDTIDVGEG